GVALGSGSGSSAGLNGFIGIGPTICYPHVGVGMGGGTSSTTGNEAFIDINGDGLPDVVRGDGNVYLNGFDPANPDRNHGLFTAQSVSSFGDLQHADGSSRTLGGGVHFPSEIGANGAYSTAHSVENLTLADMNGDGFPDLFNGTV